MRCSPTPRAAAPPRDGARTSVGARAASAHGTQPALFCVVFFLRIVIALRLVTLSLCSGSKKELAEPLHTQCFCRITHRKGSRCTMLVAGRGRCAARWRAATCCPVITPPRLSGLRACVPAYGRAAPARETPLALPLVPLPPRAAAPFSLPLSRASAPPLKETPQRLIPTPHRHSMTVETLTIHLRYNRFLPYTSQTPLQTRPRLRPLD